MAREPHQKSASGGRSGRVGKTPQAHTGRKMSFSRRMSPKMTEFLFLPPSPHWIAFGNDLWIAAWGLRRTECCETAFPGHFLFSACRPRLSPADSTPRKRAADPAPGRRPQEGQFLYLRLQVCRAPPRRPRVCRFACRCPRVCRALRRRSQTCRFPYLCSRTCRVFVPSSLSMPGFRPVISMPGFRPVISMPGFRPVILRRRSRRRIFFPFL